MGVSNVSTGSRVSPTVLRDLRFFLHRFGHGVFPVDAQTKRPFPGFRWKERASTDWAEIQRWASEHPGCGWAMKTGGDLYVVDLDGDEGIAAYTERFGERPPTFTVATPRGGLHLYFRKHPDEEMPNTAGTLGPKIDTRGDGGYVCIPPTSRSEGAYTIVGDPNVDTLEQMLTIPRERPTRADGGVGGKVPVGQQDVWLTQQAGVLVANGEHDLEALAVALGELYATRCAPAPAGVEPHGPRDFLRIARSVLERDRRGHPERHRDTSSFRQQGGTQDTAASDRKAEPVKVRKRLRLTAEQIQGDKIPETIVAGLLMENGSTLLGGRVKRGKSWLVAQMTMAICAGHPFLGLATQRRHVLYVSEMTAKTLLARMERISKDTGLPVPDIGTELDVIAPLHDEGMSLDLTHPDGQDALRAELEDIGQGGVLILDTFAKVAQLDPADHVSWMQTLEALTNLARGARWSLLAVDHTPKGGDELPPSQCFMGTTFKGAMVDMCARVRRKDGEPFQIEIEGRYDIPKDTIWYERPDGDGWGCILASAPVPADHRGMARITVAEWLQKRLRAAPEGIPRAELMDDAKRVFKEHTADHRERLLGRALDDIGGRSVNAGGFPRRTIWTLQAEEDEIL